MSQKKKEEKLGMSIWRLEEWGWQRERERRM